MSWMDRHTFLSGASSHTPHPKPTQVGPQPLGAWILSRLLVIDPWGEDSLLINIEFRLV